MKKFGPKQRLFVHEYLVDMNGTKAARRAGYSKARARFTASRLLSYPHIKRAIEKAQADRSERLEITADTVTQEIARLAFFDAKYAYNTLEGGESQMKTFEEMGPWTKCIAEIKEDRVIKEVKGSDDKADAEMILSDKRTLKFHDKTANLRTLCEYLGILKNQAPVFPSNVTFRFIYAEPEKPKDK